MNTEKAMQTDHAAFSARHRIAVGQYEERMYFIDAPTYVSAYDQTRIDDLLARNQGVGVMIGCFDEALSIRMLSGFAGRLLGYRNADDVLQETNGSLLHIAMAEESYIRQALASPTDEVCSCTFRGKDGVDIPVHICHVTGVAPDGEKLWYLSLRRLGEAYYDALTGEYNRRGFIRRVKSMKQDGADLTEYAVLCVNIRGFKAVNDLFGSEFGDRLLVRAYHHFSCSELKPAVCARKESDKFLLLVKKEDIDLKKLPNVLKIPYSVGEKAGSADCICGIYPIEDSETEISVMIDWAKMAGENIKDAFVTPYAVFCPSMRADYLSRINTLSYFDEALAKHEFKVYYQPVVDCNTGKVASAEALIRWETPDGVISPAAFIPALEENGCIAKLDEYVVASTVRHLHDRAQQGQPLLPISVNISRMDFFDEDRTQRIYTLLQQDELARRYIHFEITETSHRSIKERQAEFITKINTYGGRVYIDDFGVANSSIDMLSQYDFAVLKLDMQFIRQMVRNAKVRTLIESTILMSHKLHIEVIAEGVETAEEVVLLREMGCDYIQGYYFSKPLDGQHFAAYLDEHL